MWKKNQVNEGHSPTGAGQVQDCSQGGKKGASEDWSEHLSQVTSEALTVHCGWGIWEVGTEALVQTTIATAEIYLS